MLNMVFGWEIAIIVVTLVGVIRYQGITTKICRDKKYE